MLYECDVEVVNSIPEEDLEFIIACYQNEDLHELEELGSGASAMVYGYKDYAIKVPRDEGETDEDIIALRDLGHLEGIPTLYAVLDDSIIIMERVYGDTIGDYEDNCLSNDYSEIFTEDKLLEFENILVAIIENGYNPRDVHENNVMVDTKRNKLVIVDVGWFLPLGVNAPSEDYGSYSGYTTAFSWAGRILRRLVVRFDPTTEAQ